MSMTEALQHPWLSHFAESPGSGPRLGDVEWNIAAFDDDGPYIEDGGNFVQAGSTVACAVPSLPQTATHEEACYRPLRDLRLTTPNRGDGNSASRSAPPSPPLTDITNDDMMASESRFGDSFGEEARSASNKRRAVAPPGASSLSVISFGPAEDDVLDQPALQSPRSDARRPRKSMRMA